MVRALSAGLVGGVLLLAGPAHAGALSMGLTGSVVGAGSVGLRPGLTLGYLPTPSAALELHGDSDLDGSWDVGLVLAGRWYPSPRLEPGQGIFLLGRGGAGIAGVGSDLGPWTTLGAGFGARPAPWISVEAFAGPEWAMADGGRWRTGLNLSFLLDSDTGSGSTRHRVKRKPQ